MFDDSSGCYLQPEPLIQMTEFAESEAMKGHFVPTYGYARNNPNSNTDPTGLFVIGDRLGDCPNYYAALVKARERAGCLSASSSESDKVNRCRNAETACGANPASICDALEPGTGPSLHPTLSGGDSAIHSPFFNTVKVSIKECNDFSFIGQLTDTLLHEAQHVAGNLSDLGECAASNVTKCCLEGAMWCPAASPRACR